MSEYRIGTFLCLMGVALAAPFSAEESSDFHRFVEKEWEARVERDVYLAISLDRWDGKTLPEVSFEKARRDATFWAEQLSILQAIDPEQLETEDRLSYRILENQLGFRVDGFFRGTWAFPITSEAGFHTSFSFLPQRVSLRTRSEFEGYVRLLESFPAQVQGHIDLMRRGVARGWVLPRVVVQSALKTVEPFTVGQPEDSPFFRPLESLPEDWDATHREQLREDAREATTSVMEAYGSFYRFLSGEYLAASRDSVGLLDLPEGKGTYQWWVRHFTTLDLTPREIHDLGLREVARIEKRMLDVLKDVEFEGTFDDFLRFLRTDSRFFASTPEELLRRASRISKRADAMIPGLIGRLPRLTYGVEPVPDEIAPTYTAGRYVHGSLQQGQAGIYWVNTYDLPSRPIWALEALTLHEAVPGHHLQTSLAQELESLPEFRRHDYISAFGEGWALYAEYLGEEGGFYSSSYSYFGRLTYEMWRACRLVVDTGLHYFGWSRQKALDFLASHTALSAHEITTEVDRYIAWPGQALSYKIGEMFIRGLRERAESHLGDRFDVRQFHDRVLRNGSIPLCLLEEEVSRWIEGEISKERLDILRADVENLGAQFTCFRGDVI